MADKIAKLKSIANLRDTGILSEREFEAAKAKILSEPSPAKKGIGNTGERSQAPSKTNGSRAPVRPCTICKKEFTWMTLAKYGGKVCGRCFKSKTCRCKVCDVEKKASEMFIDERGFFCRTCYIPTVLSYSIYWLILGGLFILNFWIAVIILTAITLLFLERGVEERTEGNGLSMLAVLKKIHNSAIGPNNVRRSSIFIVVLAIILCVILAWTLASPWFVYTVNYTPNYGETGEAFTHKYYLGYLRVDIDESEYTWKTQYLRNSEELNYPWYYNYTYNPFWINYDEYGDGSDANDVADFKHRDYVSSVTLSLGIVSLAGYVLSIITGFIFYRMTAKLEPNFLHLKNREKFQIQINSFAKKLTNMKKKGVVTSSLNPYLNELEKMSASKVDDINVNNPLNTLNLMILFMVVGISFSASAILFYQQNWYEAVLDDGVNGIWQDRTWTMIASDYNFGVNHHMSPMITFLSFSIVVGLILTASHVIFLHRSCYSMVTEIIDSSSRISDIKIPSELLIDAEEPLTTTELPDPGEEILAEVVEAEPELEPEIESGKDET